MEPDIRWIVPMYGFQADWGHVDVPSKAREKLEEMAGELVGTKGLVAIYVAEGAEPGWSAEGQHGRVTDQTNPSCPFSVARSLLVATSHSLMVWSELPVASVLPSGEYTTE